MGLGLVKDRLGKTRESHRNPNPNPNPHQVCRPLPPDAAAAADASTAPAGGAELAAAPTDGRPPPQSNEGYLDDMEA